MLSTLWILLSTNSHLIWFIMALFLMQGVAAQSIESPFPDIPFKLFSSFVKENFSSKITLSQVLLVLFTITDNTDLLNLHARQQNPEYPDESSSSDSGWMRGLVRALQEKLGDGQKMLFKKADSIDLDHQITAIGEKLDGLTKVLELYPYDKNGQFKGNLKPISHASIQAAQVVCPNAVVCETTTCNPRSLLQITKVRDIPRVTLIKGTTTYENVQVLTGRCPKCKTNYLADRERVTEPDGRFTRVYLNSAKYLKIGQNLWVDRIFSNAVLNAMYSFHASAAAYQEFWNNSFYNKQGNSRQVSRRQIWQAFVQESIRSIASSSGINLELQDGLAIDDVIKEAFFILGDNGIIRAADQHTCQECTQPYRQTADIITGDDPAALVGIDENQNVPALVGDNANLAAEAAEQARQNAMHTASDTDQEMDDPNESYTTMAVVDGICIPSQHCAYDNCTSELANSRGGSFCAYHEHLHGARCRMKNCNVEKIAGTQACEIHQEQWNKHVHHHQRQTFSGARRMLQRPNESLPWQPAMQINHQPHDEPTVDNPRDNYFTPNRFYCVETICAPCGVVIAWAKFAKSESPTNILNFLEAVYPTEESRPDYICIDKGCLVLRTAIANGSWDRIWKQTTRFIVDTYHYINHRTTDYLCRKWCNPAPLNGSAPNLVIVDTDGQGQQYYKRAFNTQACEQLNSWLGGYESILKRMTPGNFNWFLHAMLFYHTRLVIEKHNKKTSGVEEEEEEENDTGDIIY
jgi:hypothetical protein